MLPLREIVVEFQGSIRSSVGAIRLRCRVATAMSLSEPGLREARAPNARRAFGSASAREHLTVIGGTPGHGTVLAHRCKPGGDGGHDRQLPGN